jgi:integrase
VQAKNSPKATSRLQEAGTQVPSAPFCYAIRTPSKSQKPGKKRRSFGLVKVLLSPECRQRLAVNLPEIDLVNKLYLNGTLPFEDAYKKVKEVRERLYKERDAKQPKRVFHSQNLRVLEEYWEKEYEDRDIINKDGRHRAIKTAVEGLGMVSLVVATKKELQAELDKSFPSANAQRRYVSILNSLLKFLGRDFRLRMRRREVTAVRHLTLSEYLVVDKLIADDGFKKLCRAAMATGARIGELFPIRTKDFVSGTFVLIETQIDKELNERETKTRKPRKAFVIAEGREWLRDWIEYEDKQALRNKHHADMLRVACKRAFPKDKERHLVFHDLRHSYAIHLLQTLGAPLGHVSRSLGNSTHVCEMYYAGFVLTDAGIDHLERLSAKA